MATSILDSDVLPISDHQISKGHDNHAPGPGERASIEHVSRHRPSATPASVGQVASDNESGEDIVAADERALEKQTDSVKDAKELKRERALDDALDDTFPASDPINLTSEPPQKVAKAPNAN